MNRNEMKTENKWKLEDIFASDAEFEKAYAAAKASASLCLKYREKLKEKEDVLNCFRDCDFVSKQLERIYAYAKMRHDEDTREAKYKDMSGRAESLYVEIASNNSFITPSLSKLKKEKLESFIKDPDFSDYDYQLKQILKNKKYILSEKEEKLLAEGGEVFSSFRNIFSMIDNADMKYGEVEDSNGNKTVLSHAKYSLFMQSPDRLLRERAFKEYYKSYIDRINTITAVYSSSVKKDCYLSAVRGYKSCLEKALINEDVPEAVYKNLVKSVGDNLKPLHEYVKFRKKALGLTEMHMYDMYVPIIENAELKLDYEEALKLVKDGLRPLGTGYGALLNRAMEERWIDVYENDGKKSGAYSFDVYGAHPLYC